VWLPAAGSWNGKYLAVGGGGWVGSINYGAWLPRSRKAMQHLPRIQGTPANRRIARPPERSPTSPSAQSMR
jgi:hypothetical protein